MECAHTHAYTEDEDADEDDDERQIWQKEVKRSQSETLLFDRKIFAFSLGLNTYSN